MPGLKIRRLGYALGAEVTGVDLTRSLDDATVSGIRAAWLEHLLLCFPGQDLTKEQFVAFVGRFGDDMDDNTGARTRDPDNHQIIFLTNKPVAGEPWDGYKAGQNWHSDKSYSDRPMTGTFLLARELPEVGGDTMFSNQYMAYESLSPTMRGILDGMSAVHDVANVKNFDQRDPALVAAQRRNYPPIVHPVVKVHSETGRKALYIGERVGQFEGMTKEESTPLLDFLNQHAVAYEFTYRHRWSLNDLVMWDNRCLMHIAPSDYDLQRQPRHMWRCSLHSPRTGRFYDPETTTSAPAERELVHAGASAPGPRLI
jgi:taurine dioxygenase